MTVQKKCLLASLTLLCLWAASCSTATPLTEESPAPPPTTVPVASPTVSEPEWMMHLSINQVRGQAFASDGTLWSATTNGLVHWIPEHSTYTFYPINAQAVAVDPDGTVWLGTRQGLLHFDGESLRKYTVAQGLIDDIVHTVQVAVDGQVWIGTEQGVSRFDGSSWNSYPTGTPVVDLSIASNGEVWIATSRGVGRYLPDQDSWVTYTQEHGLPGDQALIVAAGSEGEVWTYILWGGVYRFDGALWSEVAGVPVGIVSGIAFAADGTPWVAAGGSLHYPGGTLNYLSDNVWIDAGRRDLASVKTLATGPAGEVAVAISLGVGFYQAGEWRVLRDGPTGDQAACVAVTPDGAAWFGFGDLSTSTPGGGLSRLNEDEWQYFLEDAEVNVLAVAPDGKLWAGVGSSVMRFDGQIWETVGNCDNDFTACGNVFNIAFAADGTAWMANGFTLASFDGQAWTNYDMLANSVMVGADGSVWVDGWRGLIGSYYRARFDGSDWTYYPPDAPFAQVRPEITTRDGKQWVFVPEHGLVSFDGQTWTAYPISDGLEPYALTSLSVGPDGSLWMAGRGGIAFLDEIDSAAATWNLYTIDEDIPANHLGPASFGPQGEIWIGTTLFWRDLVADAASEVPVTAVPLDVQETAQPQEPPVDDLSSADDTGSSCISVQGISTQICLPEGNNISLNNEPNRRGSFVSYDIHSLGDTTPHFYELQFFSEESIREFTADCGGDVPCFFGDYPDMDRYDGQLAALETGSAYGEYDLVSFNGRPYLVTSYPCHGDACLIREYTTFLGEVKLDIWILMADESEIAQSDELFAQLAINNLPGIVPTGPNASSMKGFELYSWQTDGIWYYALVIGTNRAKTFDEISSPDVFLLGVDELLTALSQLASGEQVFWLMQRLPETASPPTADIEAVTAFCQAHGLRLEIVD